tara:strand:+ start:438 stop:920 length:483 start_codon:yes stop_codon:yes gene_type:complete
MPFNGRVKMTIQDNYNTPKKGWEDIMQYIPNKQQRIWCPFYNDGKCKEILNEMGYENIIHSNKDFFTYHEENCLCIDNPPYSIKEKVIQKLYDQNIPFALLLPMDTLERKYMKKFLNNLQVVIPSIRYEYTEGRSNPPFKSVWICWNMNQYLPNQQLIFL